MQQVTITIEVPDGCTVSVRPVVVEGAAPVAPPPVDAPAPAVGLAELKQAFLDAVAVNKAEAFAIMGVPKCVEVPPSQYEVVIARLKTLRNI